VEGVFAAVRAEFPFAEVSNPTLCQTMLRRPTVKVIGSTYDAFVTPLLPLASKLLPTATEEVPTQPALRLVRLP
jgi:hypothetical protein